MRPATALAALLMLGACSQAEKTVGPFSQSIRPFTVNGRQTLCFVNVN